MIAPGPYQSVRAAALDVLTNHHEAQTWKTASFLGQCCCADRPLSERQRKWLKQILERHSLPPLAGVAL